MHNAAVVRRSVWAYYIATACESAYFPIGVYLLYYHNQLGLSFTQGIMLFLATWIPSILFDLFGGAVADARGKKRSYAIGIILYLAGSVVPLLFIKDFYVLIGLAITGGLGMALASNSLSALVSELLHDHPKQFQRVNAHALMVLFMGRAAAALAGGWLFTVTPALPFVLYIAACLLAVGAAMFMHEPARMHAAREQTYHIIRKAVHYVWIRPPIMSAALGVCLGFLGGDTLFPYYQPFFTEHGYDPAFLGTLLAAISVCSAFGAWVVKFGHHRHWRLGIIICANVIMALNGLAFITNTPQLAMVGALIMAVASGLYVPTLRLVVHEHTRSDIRTSVLSVASSVMYIGTLLGFLASGLIADHATAAWAGGMAIFAGLGSLWLLLYRQRISEED